jgi:hypothetical protein
MLYRGDLSWSTSRYVQYCIPACLPTFSSNFGTHQHTRRIVRITNQTGPGIQDEGDWIENIPLVPSRSLYFPPANNKTGHSS